MRGLEIRQNYLLHKIKSNNNLESKNNIELNEIIKNNLDSAKDKN